MMTLLSIVVRDGGCAVVLVPPFIADMAFVIKFGDVVKRTMDGFCNIACIVSMSDAFICAVTVSKGVWVWVVDVINNCLKEKMN